VIAMVYDEPARAPRLYDEGDLPWIAQLLDIVERSVGEPWRVLVERVEYAPLRVHPSHRAAMLQALRRVLGGAGQRARIARRARALVLGPPALDPAERQARLATAAATLGTTPEDVESLLWIDLAMERPVVLPEGRPVETELAAFANLERIQRCVRRAHDLQLRVWDRATELVRTVARYGLISQIRCDGAATVLDVMGPLALFHSTIVYGRALAQLVPLLAGHPRFELDIRCRISGEEARLHVAPPVRLPPAPAARRVPSAAERLASDLEALGHAVEREPPPIASGAHLLFPDLVLGRGGARWFIEVLGFATRDYLTAKLDRYRGAGIPRVVLCADLATAPGCDLAAQVCGFTRHVEVGDLLATIERSETGSRDPDSSAGGAGGRAPRGIDAGPGG
jgi:predicted nuclease of restriction endonuclease-like RecB superfamily